MSIAVGSIGYATKSGLGLLMKRFYDKGVINRVYLVKHPHYQNYQLGWYNPEDVYYSSDNLFDGLDVLLLFENAVGNNWSLVERARQLGIKIVMMPMYEWTPMPLPVPADLYLCPSDLDQQYYSSLPHVRINVPVEVPWKLRTKAEVFIHNAGHGGSHFRNGTPELLDAMQYVKSPVKLIVRGQPGERQIERLFQDGWRKTHDPRITYVLQDVPEEELYSTGDVFIFPEKFNGLSLPLQEAYASGMLVMAGDRFPINKWLPENPLIPVHRYVKDRMNSSCPEFDKADINAITIAAQIDNWYGRPIEQYSNYGRYWAEENSWEVLKPQYMEILEGLVS